MAGPIMDASVLTYEGISIVPTESYLDFTEPAWVLGKHFLLEDDLDQFNEEVRSLLWFTYRKNFKPIGGTGPTSDAGWGCMLRCGQMMLAQAMTLRHLGRKWKWKPKMTDSTYMMILKSFLEKKDSLYSIHQIAQMGVSEGKQIGQWFGPNTVSQVIKKLIMFDDWSNLAVHVAMDNTLVIEDIKKLCKSSYSSWECYGACTSAKEGGSTAGAVIPNEQCSCGKSVIDRSGNPRRSVNKMGPYKRTQSFGLNTSSWRPLILFIPLRLGLSETNSAYYSALKACLTIKESLGFIGGKPNHAYYFIGFNAHRLIYLDPHTTQPTISPAKYSAIPDESYHCVYPCFMNFAELDPSIALGFYCHTEAEFDDLCDAITQLIIDGQKRPMFEISIKRPAHWPPFELPKRPCDDLDCARADFTELTFDYGEDDRTFDTDGEYEII
ncbi:cysteine protease ATG4B-like [Rhopilema esculentum]|uniref:cysteine protease ATG4B-like n=1 Tax=Rhopilema esculentum TaxID=499914 RepID=UPI0031D160C4|eukprot:gene16749-8208_t